MAHKIVLRNSKGAALTHTEMDLNFATFFLSASVVDNRITLRSLGSGSANPPQNITLTVDTGSYTAGSGLQEQGYEFSLKDNGNFINNRVQKWDTTNQRFINSMITDDGSKVVITGGLEVQGTTTTIESTTVNIGDNIISLNGTAAANAGIEVNDATAPNTVSGSFIWKGANDRWFAGRKGFEEPIVLQRGDYVMTGSFGVSGDTSFGNAGSDKHSYTGSLSVDGALNVGGNTSLSGSLKIEKDTTIGAASTDKHSVTGSLSLVDDLYVYGNTAITGGLLVEESIEGNSDLYLQGNARITGSATVEGNLNVSSNAYIQGDARITGSLFVEGTTTSVGNAALTGNQTITGNLTVNGNTILGDAATDTVTINATPTFAENATFTKNVTVNGNTTLGNAAADTVTVNATPTFAEDTTFSKNVVVNGNTTLGNAATDTVTVKGPITAENNLTVQGNTVLGDAVGDTITVNGTPTFKENVTMEKALTVNGTTTIGDAATDTHTLNGIFTLNGSILGLLSGSGQVDHDTTTNFVANEHIDHTTVTMTAGAGLTGGGTIAATRTFAVGAGDGITVNADDVALASTTAGNGLTYTAGVLAVGAGDGISVAADAISLATTTGGAGLTYTAGVLAVGAGTGITVNADDIAVNAGAVDHDALLNFVANEHIDHSAVTFTAGAGLTGGGTLEANRTFTVGAGDGITVNADDIALASTTAGAGLTYTAGVLAVGAGDGIVVSADQVALANTVAGDGLIYNGGAVLSVDSSDAGGAGKIAKYNASGELVAADFVVSSDKRLKSEIQPIREGLQVLKQFVPFEYQKAGRKEAGWIAQDVQQVLPYSVQQGEDGYLRMSDRAIVAHIHKAILEIEERLSSLEDKIK